MVRSVCAVYSRHPRYVPQQLAREIHHGTNPFFTEVITPVTRPQDREQIVNGGPCVIVSSSGMLWGGPSAGYAASLAPNPANAILITGYQDEESPGRALLNLAQQSGPRSLALADKTVPVECRFETYSLSAHADRMQIAGLIEALDPRSVVLVHGDRQAKQELADALYTRDVELADDGAVIVRGYPVRNKTATSVGPALLTPSAAVRIVGPATGSPLNAARMAEAWLGREPTAEETAALTAQLEDFGLIQRDSGSPDLLWPLTQPARLAQPTAEDLAMEQQLKEENPKGTLLEICMRRRLPPPRKLATIHRGRHAVELRITIDGQEIVSEPQFAHAEKMAEQLAARELLRQFSLLSPVEELRRITDADAAELRQTNPKGRLLELVAQNKWARPLIETRAVPNGFIGAASLRLPHGQTLQAVPAVASQNKIAEQAACASLLERAQAWMAETAPEGALPPATVPAARASGAEASPDPRMVLNELRQRAVIADFGYEQTNQHGPHHALVFTFLAWATTPDGRRIESGPVDGVNKRNAQLRAATDLVGLLTQHGAIANDPPEE